MSKPEKELVQAGRAALAWVRNGTPPPAGLMADKRKPYSGLPGVKGGSANLGKLAHLFGLIRGLASSRDFFVDLMTDCLTRGLQGGEQVSGYGDLHTAGEALAWWHCWREGDSELGSLLGASLERTALLHSLCGRLLPNGDLQLLAPGMRFDKGGPGRVTESAMWARLLGTGGNEVKVREEEGKTWSGGLFLQALREADGIGEAVYRVDGHCLDLLQARITPQDVRDYLSRVRLWCPMVWELYHHADFFAYLQAPPGQTHPQDPAMPGGGVVNGQPRVLWPFKEGEDPGEGGWRVEVRRDSVVVDATWKRREEERFAGTILPQPLLRLTFGPEGVEGLPAADPLGDLPPLPPPSGDEPRKPGPKPTPEPPPEEEEEPMPAEPDRHPIPRHEVKRWLTPEARERFGGPVSEVIWQAGRLAMGEPHAEERQVAAYEALEKASKR